MACWHINDINHIRVTAAELEVDIEIFMTVVSFSQVQRKQVSKIFGVTWYVNFNF